MGDGKLGMMRDDYWEVRDLFYSRKVKADNNNGDFISIIKQKYEENSNADIGSYMNCPICNRKIRKKSYQHKFCSNKGSGNCKDRYWNIVDENRLKRAKLFGKGE